jgi:hypothetical protein
LEKHLLKSLEDAFNVLNADVKKCRAGHQALVQLAAFNGTGDAMALTIAELEAAAERLVKDARAFAKAVADLAAAERADTTSNTND